VQILSHGVLLGRKAAIRVELAPTTILWRYQSEVADPTELPPLAERVASVPVKAQRFKPLHPAWRQDAGAPRDALHAAPAWACTALLGKYQILKKTTNRAVL
jgi:hypothetical protein